MADNMLNETVNLLGQRGIERERASKREGKREER